MKLNLESKVKFILAMLVACFSLNLNAQQVLLTDDFNSGPGNWTPNSTDQVNGVFTVGGGGENLWIVNNDYAGNTGVSVPNTNRQPAGIAGAPNSGYLHIISRNYLAASILNANYQYNVPGPHEIYMTRMTNDVNTTGLTDVKFNFWWLNYAEAALSTGLPARSGGVVYSTDGGNTWLPTGFAMANDSIWGDTTLSLPTFNNQGTLRFGFIFVNPDTGFSPAFAIDDVSITGVPSGTPTADFTADKTLVCKGDCVQFTDASTGNPTQWKWSFGTGVAADTSNLQNPQFCFNNVGNFSISLTASNSLGSGAVNTKTGYIQVVDCNTPPDANFGMNGSTANNITICAGDSIAFADSSIGVVNSRYWSFPGAQDDSGRCRLVNDTNQQVSVFYPCSGARGRDTTYTVTLNVSGTGGADFVTKNIVVKGCVPAKARIVNENQRKLCVNDCITFRYDYSVKDEFFVTTDSMDFKWYVRGIRTDIWDGYYYSNYITDTSVLSDASLSDTTFTGDSLRVCYEDRRENWDVSLVVENIFGKDSVVYKEFVSVMEYPDVSVLYDDTTIVRGHRALLSAKKDAGFAERSYCADLREVEKLRGDTCCCFNYFWIYPDETGKLVRDDIEQFRERSTYVEPTEDTWYYVIKENYNGCRVMDSMQVILRKDGDDIQYSVGVPDIFSPGSGRYQNKHFYVFGNGITKIDVKIYNRFGQIVYQTEDVDEIVIEDPLNQGAKTGWRGTFNNEIGRDLTPGVYTYFIQVYHENGDFKELQGNVTLVR